MFETVEINHSHLMLHIVGKANETEGDISRMQ